MKGQACARPGLPERGRDGSAQGLVCHGWAVLSLATMLVTLSGCITVYQPMSGLHDPVAIDPGQANFTGVSVSVLCAPGPDLRRRNAQRLCARLSQLFENQGATVRTGTSVGLKDDLADAAPEDDVETAAPMALNVEIKTRLIHVDEITYLFFWDQITDYTFAQDITIRDETGFLLLRETFMGRFIQRIGFNDEPGVPFSKDYYGRISQLAYNAKMRREVLNAGPRPTVAE